MRPVADAGPVGARLAKARMIIGNDAPYEPVGFDGEKYWVLDSMRFLRGCKPPDIRERWLISICGGSKYLEQRYPRAARGRTKQPNGIEYLKAGEDLMAACNQLGFWEPTNIRGTGAWKGEDGDLILHRGDCLVVNGTIRQLGRLGEYCYVHAPPLPMWEPDDPKAQPAIELLERLEPMPFEGGAFAARLMLGMFCVALVSGALRFRPHCFLGGEIDTGKTRIQTMLRAVTGDNGVVSVTDATAAAIWQGLRNRSVPIGFDEFEQDADGRRSERILSLARQASTGGMLRRGSSGHNAQEFPIVSAFICSATTTPPFNAADASRWLTISLRKQRFFPPFSLDRLEAIGVQLTARLARNWRMLQAQVVPEIGRLMLERHYPGRIIDMYGTLIGLINVVLFDRPEDMGLAAQIDDLPMRELLQKALGEQVPEWRSCLDHMLSSRTEKQRATSEQFGELVADVADPIMQALRHGRQSTLIGDPEALHDEARSAQSRLLAFGMRVAIVQNPADGEREAVLQIAHRNQQLAELYQDTRWRTTHDSVTGGGWTAAFRRAPGAWASKQPVRFRAGVLSRAMNIPLSLVLQKQPQPGAPEQQDYDQPESGAAMH
jgi:hypothetical protein